MSFSSMPSTAALVMSSCIVSHLFFHASSLTPVFEDQLSLGCCRIVRRSRLPM